MKPALDRAYLVLDEHVRAFPPATLAIADRQAAAARDALLEHYGVDLEYEAERDAAVAVLDMLVRAIVTDSCAFNNTLACLQQAVQRANAAAAAQTGSGA